MALIALCITACGDEQSSRSQSTIVEPPGTATTELVSTGVAAAAAPPPEEAGSFFAEYLRCPPAARDAEALKSLLESYVNAPAHEAAAPVGFPSAEDVEQQLREATRRMLPPEWSPYLEYSIASRACNKGDMAAMHRAADALDAFASANPHVSSYASERALLLADLRRALGDYRGALAIVDRLRLDPAVTADHTLHSEALGVRGEVMRETGRIDEASVMVRESLAAATRSNNQDAITRAVVRQQALALVTGRFDETRAAVDRLLASRVAEDGEARTLLLVFRGFAEAGVADQDPAMLTVARQTLDEVRPRANGHLRVRVDLKRLDLALRQNDLPGATQALADCDESLGPLAPDREPTRDEIERIGLATRLLLQRDAEVGELRSWHLVQQRAERAMIAEWRQHDPAQGGIGFLQLSDRRELLAAGIELELRLASLEKRSDGPARALQILLDQQAETSLARHRGAATCSVATLQRDLLQDRHAALVLLPSRRRSWAFLAEAATVTAWELKGGSILSRAGEAVVSSLARTPATRGETRELRDSSLHAVLGSARELLLPESLQARVTQVAHLTVVGADLVEGVPFETLLLDDGRLLGEAVPISNTASLPLVAAIAKTTTPAKSAAARVVVFGCTSPEAVPEAARVVAFEFPIAELQPGLDRYPHPPTVLVDEQVTRDVVLDARFEDHDIVHFVTHHVHGVGGTAYGALVVRDGLLSALDFEERRLRGLVIVSACGSGLGPARSGEGEDFASLAGAFSWNGANAVVASRTELLVLDHLRLMQRVHTQLAAGKSPAAALQIARAAMAPDTDWLARAHRAAVQVFGAGHLPLLR